MTDWGTGGLRPFLQKLEAERQLVRVKKTVSAHLEISAIIQQVIRDRGPALFFESVEGSPFPVVANLFGSRERIRLALGGEPRAIGEELVKTVERLKKPTLSALWRSRKAGLRVLRMRPRRVRSGPVCDVTTTPNLDILPVLTCWPGDAGRFFTLAATMTKHPTTGERNLGLYRLQCQSQVQTGMHWQIHRGGGNHFWEAERRGEDLPVTVTLGGSVALLFAASAPLPEDMDELLMAGLIEGKGIPLLQDADGVNRPEIVADAEIVLVGTVPAGVREPEGPFGDHFGHYSHQADFPIIRMTEMYHRRDAIFPVTVVGKPPQEDWWWGGALQELMVPLLQLIKPEIKDLWTYPETGFHGLGVMAVKQRYTREGLRSAFGMLGEGQVSLTKCLVIVDPDCPVRSFENVLDRIHRYFDPAQDLIIIPGTAYDTLDFTSRRMNLGSKMIVDATAGATPVSRPPVDRNIVNQIFSSRGLQWHLWEPSLAAVCVPKTRTGRAVAEDLRTCAELDSLSMIVLVSPDVPMADPVLFPWGWFTRFEPARDLYFRTQTFVDAAPRYEGPVIFDATWKTGYPEPLEMDPDIEKKVKTEWDSYGISV